MNQKYKNILIFTVLVVFGIIIGIGYSAKYGAPAKIQGMFSSADSAGACDAYDVAHDQALANWQAAIRRGKSASSVAAFAAAEGVAHQALVDCLNSNGSLGGSGSNPLNQ